MGLRFRRSIKICKGVKLNFGKSGASISLGPRGAHYTIHTSGKQTASVGMPGTGLSYTKSFGGKKKKGSQKENEKKVGVQQQTPPQEQLQEPEAEHAAGDEREKNSVLVQEYEDYIDVIRNVHRECREEIVWENIAAVPKPAPGEANETDEEIRDWKMMHEFANRVLSGDTDAYLDIINEADLFGDLVEYGSDFEFGTDNRDSVEIEFNVKSESVVPETSLSLGKGEELCEKELTKTQYYDYTLDYVCSCAIRLAREMFAILPIRFAIVHAVDQKLDTTTGHECDITILSVVFDKERFQDINFDRIDASDFLKSFRHNLKFAKTAGFKEVPRIDESEMGQ